MSKSTYVEIILISVNRDAEDLLTASLLDFGAQGFHEDLDFSLGQMDYVPTAVEPDVFKMKVYFYTQEEAQNAKDWVLNHYPSVGCELSVKENEDWMTQWKKGFTSFSLVENYWIVPSWEVVNDKKIQPLFIDPGMAFGTGTHETTQLCSELIYKYTQQNKDGASLTVAADVGTGTGVLAILMEKCGLDEIHCCDIDPECERVTRENFLRNKVEKCIWQKDLSSIPSCQLMVANIIDGVLMKLMPNLVTKTKPGGLLIFSGILRERESGFLDFMKSFERLDLVELCQKEEWSAAVYGVKEES